MVVVILLLSGLRFFGQRSDWVDALGAIGVVQFLRPTVRFARRFLFVRGILLMLALVALWGVPALLRTHGEFLPNRTGRACCRTNFRHDAGTRRKFHAAALISLPFYFFSVFLSFAPWSWKLPWLRSPDGKSEIRLIFISFRGCPVVLLIFTVVKTKLPHYILPAFPLLALLLARHWLDAGVLRAVLRRWSVATAAVMLAVGWLDFHCSRLSLPSDALFKKAEAISPTGDGFCSL